MAHAAALATPRQPAKDARFWDRIAKRYAAQPVSAPDVYARKLDAIRARLTDESTVVEFGCGTGSTALTLSAQAKSFHATDFSPEMIAIAREKAAAAAVSNVTFETAGIWDVKAPDGGYDMALAMNLLHLMPEWRAAIAQIRSLVRPGGFFISSTACLDDGMIWLRPVSWVARQFGWFPRISFFREKALLAAIRAEGFEIEETWRPGKRAANFVIARRID